MLLHRSDLNISENFRQFFSHFRQIFVKICYFEFLSLIFAQILMKFCRNFADILENVETRKFLKFERLPTELRSERFEWFGPSPLEPFNSALSTRGQRSPAREALQLAEQSAETSARRIFFVRATVDSVEAATLLAKFGWN